MSREELAWIRAFAPATVANVACGFDVFGFAVEEPGDVVAARRREGTGVVLSEVTGDGGRLPRDAGRNSAGAAVLHLMREAAGGGRDLPGVELRLAKGLPLASGLGSSAASGVAAVVAVDALLGLGAPRDALLRAAVEGERAACGSAHADNAAPALYGGFVLVRGPHQSPPSPRGALVTELPVPAGLTAVLVRPHIEVDTGAARALLGDRIGLGQAVTQWGNAAALVAGLFRADHDLIASALHDAVAEPVRSAAVPGFAEVKAAAIESGALGCSLSGSGPTIFAFSRDAAGARVVAAKMEDALRRASGLDCDVYVTPVGAPGARLIAEEDLRCAS